MEKIDEKPLVNKFHNPNDKFLVPSIIILTVLISGAIITGMNPGFIEWPDFDAERILIGDWTNTYQRRYEDELPIRSFSRTLWGLIRYSLFKEGEDGVLLGSNGWLFTSQEFSLRANSEENFSESIAYIKDVKEKLSKMDITLVVVVVPAKSRVYPEHLGRYVFPSYHEKRYERFRDSLSELGILAPNSLSALSSKRARERTFLRTDTHWSPYGALSVAKELSGTVKTILGSRGIKMHSYSTSRGGKIRYEGDLMSFIPLGPLRAKVGPKPDTVYSITFTKKSDSEQSLFGEIQSPVVLVGTSYSAGELWNFDGAVQAMLGVDVINSAVEGKGPFVPMQTFLKDLSSRNDINPHVVIWEIPERYIDNFSLN